MKCFCNTFRDSGAHRLCAINAVRVRAIAECQAAGMNTACIQLHCTYPICATCTHTVHGSACRHTDMPAAGNAPNGSYVAMNSARVTIIRWPGACAACKTTCVCTDHRHFMLTKGPCKAVLQTKKPRHNCRGILPEDYSGLGASTGHTPAHAPHSMQVSASIT